MKQTIKKNPKKKNNMEVDNILNNIPDKRQDTNTTSLVFKKDLIKFFDDNYLDKKCYEIGTYRGFSTRLLSFLFKKVKTIDDAQGSIDIAKKFNIYAVMFIIKI